jgi:hypothetical protein
MRTVMTPTSNALASKLAVIKEGDPDELRLWVSWATFDPSTNGIATIGYVHSDW